MVRYIAHITAVTETEYKSGFESKEDILYLAYGLSFVRVWGENYLYHNCTTLIVLWFCTTIMSLSGTYIMGYGYEMISTEQNLSWVMLQQSYVYAKQI